MKRMKFSLILFLVLIIGVSSCTKELTGEVAPGELIESITASVEENNALRVDVSIEFKHKVDYQITYWKEGDESEKRTTLSKNSDSDGSSATLIFLEPAIKYNFEVQANTGNAHTTSDIYAFTTGSLPSDAPVYTLEVDNMTQDLKGYIMQISGNTPGYITFCTTKGTIVWYEDMGEPVRVAYFDTLTNTISCLIGIPSPDYFYRLADKIILTDLYGNRILDRSVSADWIAYPHHEIRRMPNGNIIVVENVVDTFDLSAYGGSTTEPVWGDGYVIMDAAGNIKERWNCFSELNPQNDASIMSKKTDWLHANSVNWDSDGNLYMTYNKISELWKIDYTTKKVLYRVGKKGTVTLDAAGYATGLHAPVPISPDYVLCLDNHGGTDGGSRALIYSVNTSSKTADVPLSMSYPLKYSTADRGNVEKINDDLLMFGSTLGYATVFTDMDGNILRVIRRLNISYRSNYFSDINF
jgi:arylsulfate sulfotransferase